jgi:hypothetical protein
MFSLVFAHREKGNGVYAFCYICAHMNTVHQNYKNYSILQPLKFSSLVTYS